MANCECNIAAAFPILGSYGIISASLRMDTDISFIETGCGTSLILEGFTRGNLSITAYAPLGGENLSCPGSANVSFNWDQRLECGAVHIMPRGATRASMEGDVTSKIQMTQAGSPLLTFNASASSGPHTPYLQTYHRSGYNFSYSGQPLSVSPQDGRSPKSVPFLANVLPAGANLYLNSFNWSYTPPNIPTTSYSFLVIHD